MIGALRHRVTIEEKTQTPDGEGGFTEAWATRAEVFAALEPGAGEDVPQAEQFVAKQRWRLRIRWRNDVTPAQRINFETRLLAISAATDPDGRKRWLVLDCVENAVE